MQSIAQGPRTQLSRPRDVMRMPAGLSIFFLFLDPRILGSSNIRTEPRRIRIDPGFGGFVLPLLVTSIKMAGGACKCGVGSVLHRRKSERSDSNAAVLYAGVSLSWAGPTQHQMKAGYPEGVGRSFHQFVLLS